MKSVFIAGSRKFYDEIESFVKSLRDAGIAVTTVGKWDKTKKDSLKSEKKALLEAFTYIDRCDIVYVYSRDGYIGKTVAMEIAYAYARGKEIVALEKIEELSARGLVDRVMGRQAFVIYCK